LAYVGGGNVKQWRYYDGVDPDKKYILEMLRLKGFHFDLLSENKDNIRITAED